MLCEFFLLFYVLETQTSRRQTLVCFHKDRTSRLLLPPPSSCLSPPSPSVCGQESPFFCSKQQVEPKAVHTFLINEFKDELFIYHFFFLFLFLNLSSLHLHSSCVHALCSRIRYSGFSRRDFSKFCSE